MPRGRPKKFKVASEQEKKEKAANNQKGTKKCSFCHEEMRLIDFYISKNPIHSLDERVPICKKCIAKEVLTEDGVIDEIAFNRILRAIDRPYYKDTLETSEKQFLREHSYIAEDKVKYYGEKILALYFKNIALRQDRCKSYEDSEKDDFLHQNNNTPRSVKEQIAQKYADLTNVDKKTGEIIMEKKVTIENDDFEVTDDIIRLFGEGYTKTDYRKMYQKYEKLKLGYTLKTSLHQETLATYVRFKVKEEEATAKGNVDEAKKWYDAAQNAASSGKLTPKQLSDADLQGGLNTFSELFKAVEEVVDVIHILPRFKTRPNDALDFVIWCYINYGRSLENLPQCSYSDVYKFYDKKKKEYIEQYGDPYGIFEDDISEDLRPNIKKFITLPKDYGDGD